MEKLCLLYDSSYAMQQYIMYQESVFKCNLAHYTYGKNKRFQFCESVEISVCYSFERSRLLNCERGEG